MAPSKYARIVLAERPKGDVTATTFKKEVVDWDLSVREGEVLVQVIYISIDPAMRGWLDDRRGYMKPVQIGEVMRAGALGYVAKTGKGSKLSVGDLVYGGLGMFSYNTIMFRHK